MPPPQPPISIQLQPPEPAGEPSIGTGQFQTGIEKKMTTATGDAEKDITTTEPSKHRITTINEHYQPPGSHFIIKPRARNDQQ
ncbi:hypothetical protein RHGRI_003191 [Rhododendron griersonianum]|uniref:Uncharacterized protein n=1 Tax=Rhododendron griersonianum TaxID=479676 RepID=A0AAV6L3Z7_9ERIC|nr:hypothetical protein RHGRI_003191 [Rhododendron griersonianum]